MTTAKSTAKSTAKATTKKAAKATGGIVSSARDLVGQMGAVSATLVETLPDAAETVRGSAMDVYRSVDSMPKKQQTTVTRASLGIGAAMFVLGAPRILTFLAFLPALVLGGLRLARHAR
jgi:hypothetical protein